MKPTPYIVADEEVKKTLTTVTSVGVFFALNLTISVYSYFI